MLTRLFILTPQTRLSPEDLVQEGTAVAGDLIADFRNFPATVVIVSAIAQCEDITDELIGYPDYWHVVRQWLANVTGRAQLQDRLSISNYGFWWTLNSQRFVPGLNEIGNLFVWIDLLRAINQRMTIENTVLVFGDNTQLCHILGQIFPEYKTQVIQQTTPESKRPLKSPLLLVLRFVVAVAYFSYTLFRRPDICLLSDTNLLRLVEHDGEILLRDIYIGDVAERLANQGWRVTLIEKYGENASLRGLLARGFIFPNDMIFLFGTIYRRFRVSEWRSQWQKIEPKLSGLFDYHGCDLSVVMLPIIRREFLLHGPELEGMLRAWQIILRMWNPGAIYINNSYSHSAWPLVVAAKKLQILTIEQQHGLIGRNHFAYLVPREAAQDSQFPLCDRMVVWGEYTKRFLRASDVYRTEDISVCGFPRVDALLSDLPSRESTIDSLSIPADARVVLYTSNEFAQGFVTALLDSIQAVKAEPNLHWIIKLHPRETTEKSWLTAVRERQLECVTIIRQADIYALLAACDIHVSYASTTLIEAALLGRLNLGFKSTYVADPAGFFDAGAFLPINAEQLGETVVDLLNNREEMIKLLVNQKRFAQDYCRFDGQSVARIVALIGASISATKHNQ